MEPAAEATPPEPPRGGAEGRSRIPIARTVVGTALGAGVLVLLVWYVGVDAIHAHLEALGWRAPLVLLPWVVIAVVDALGWRVVLPGEDAARVPLHSLTLVRLAGEAVNGLLPTAAWGEPLKAHLLRRWGIPLPEGLASIVIAKTTLVVSQSLFVVLGIAAVSARVGRGWWGLGVVALLLALTAAFAAGLVRLQRRAPVATLWGWVKRILPRAAAATRIEAGVHVIDTRLERFYGYQRGAFWGSSAWYLLAWCVGVTEPMLIMWLIDAPIGWSDALIIEALSQPIRAAAIVIPGGLGTQEVGGVALCTFIGMPPDQAATLWLLKRGRELVVDSVGLLYLAYHTARGPARQ